MTASKERRTSPETVHVQTSDLGMVEFPHFCPGWCDREDHLAFATENEGIDAAEKLMEHRRSSGGDTYLPTITNNVDGRVERPGGDWWDLVARQPVLNPAQANHYGYRSAPLLDLMLRPGEAGRGGRIATISMTTGEARVMAAHIIALCDRVDLNR